MLRSGRLRGGARGARSRCRGLAAARACRSDSAPGRLGRGAERVASELARNLATS